MSIVPFSSVSSVPSVVKSEFDGRPMSRSLRKGDAKARMAGMKSGFGSACHGASMALPGHVALRSTLPRPPGDQYRVDLPGLRPYSCDVLGFENINQSRPGDEFDRALLRHGDAELMLNTM